MPFPETEPFASIRSLEELFAVASAMEREAIDGYFELARRMRRENRPGLADVFDRLVAEESLHLGNVAHWSKRLTGREPDPKALRWDMEPTLDDEGAGAVAPELLSAYRAFSIAVRNEERAFAFWTYVASSGTSRSLREAAEQMAREELDHVATLRRERRRAFHAERAAALATEGDGWTLAALESRLAAFLDAAAGEADLAGDKKRLGQLALQARKRADALAHAPLGDTPILKHVPPQAAARLRPTVELLLECYLDLGERLPSQTGRERAQSCAAQLLDCVSATRSAVSPAETAGSG